MAAKNVSQSPLERSSLASLDHKLAMAKRCSHGIFLLSFICTYLCCRMGLIDVVLMSTEGVVAGAKAAVVASIATAIPTVSLLSI